MINPDCLQGVDFLNKYISDYKKLEECGFNRMQIIKMLNTQQYVKDFIDTPEWLVSVKKLPEGYKWNDGIKYQQKGAKKKDSETYIFLIIENDLYIKGLLDKKYEIYSETRSDEIGVPYIIGIRDKRICVIKDWKSKKDHKVNACIGITPFFENSLSNFWCANGGNMSMQEDDPIANKFAELLFGGGENGKVP